MKQLEREQERERRGEEGWEEERCELERRVQEKEERERELTEVRCSVRRCERKDSKTQTHYHLYRGCVFCYLISGGGSLPLASVVRGVWY